MSNRNNNSNNCIDFVIAWVDGSDSSWRKKQAECLGTDANTDDRLFRDWGFLKYLFRSIELYAPWVHHVYLVTDQQKNAWLESDSAKQMVPNTLAKLSIVDHSDFIPEQYLPTFNSHPIELNFHRIQGICNQFVYFNDDFLLTKPCKPEDFFMNGMPVDEACLNGINGKDSVFAGIQFHNISTINRHYNISNVRKNLKKWLNPIYGKENIRTLLLLPFKRIQGIHNPHGPMPLLKSTYEKVWERDGDILEKTCFCKERKESNVSVYLMRYEQLLSGNFVPHKNENVYLEVSDSVEQIRKGMRKGKSVCINDVEMEQDSFQIKKKEIIELLDELYQMNGDG